jgi:tetratricopeptide (TPR) repeat protein
MTTAERHLLGTALAVAALAASMSLPAWAQAPAPSPAAARPVGGDPLPELRRLVEASQFDAAYALAKANPRRQGDPHFDFLLGLAAVNTGRVPEGLLALERHLAKIPANDRARLELARGYFLLGEYARARAEFEFVLRFNPPPAVRANIRQFLDAMQLRDSAEGRSSSRFYVEAGAGHDSNVNGGTFRDRIDQAFGGSIDLRGTDAQGRGDGFGQVAVGVQQQWAATPRFSVFASADLDHKANQDERDFDFSSASVQAGFTQLREGGLWRLTLGWNTLWVAGNTNRSTFALGNEWQWALEGGWQLALIGQHAELRNNRNDEVRDSRTTTVGFGANRSLGGPQAWTLGGRLAWAQEDNLRLRRDLDRTSPQLRLTAGMSPAAGWRLNGGFAIARSRYGDIDLGFQTLRVDTTLAADLVLSWALNRQWTLRAEWQGSRNDSNQTLYDSKRQSFSLKARWQP